MFDHTGLVVLGCNIHDPMVAWVYIVDTPWFGKSGSRRHRHAQRSAGR